MLLRKHERQCSRILVDQTLVALWKMRERRDNAMMLFTLEPSQLIFPGLLVVALASKGQSAESERHILTGGVSIIQIMHSDQLLQPLRLAVQSQLHKVLSAGHRRQWLQHGAVGRRCHIGRSRGVAGGRHAVQLPGQRGNLAILRKQVLLELGCTRLQSAVSQDISSDWLSFNRASCLVTYQLDQALGSDVIAGTPHSKLHEWRG